MGIATSFPGARPLLVFLDCCTAMAAGGSSMRVGPYAVAQPNPSPWSAVAGAIARDVDPAAGTRVWIGTTTFLDGSLFFADSTGAGAASCPMGAAVTSCLFACASAARRVPEAPSAGRVSANSWEDSSGPCRRVCSMTILWALRTMGGHAILVIRPRMPYALHAWGLVCHCIAAVGTDCACEATVYKAEHGVAIDMVRHMHRCNSSRR